MAPSTPAAVGRAGKLSAEAALARYRTLPAASESFPPIGLESHRYGSNPAAALVPTPADRADLLGSIGTPPEVAKLAEAGAANAFSPEFKALLDNAIAANGGLGNAEDGYLAFSREHGFVRYRNPNFLPEENRKLAAMTLMTGWPLERLPSRQHWNSTVDDPKMSKWVTEFTGKFEEKFAAFLKNPQAGLRMKDGSRNCYALTFDSQSGRIFSQASRLKGGLAGMVQRNMKWIGPILQAVSFVAAPVAPYISAGVELLRNGLNAIVTGKFGVRAMLQAATAFIPGVGRFMQANPLASIAIRTGAEAIDTGRIGYRALLSSLGDQYANGLPGGKVVDEAAQAMLTYAGSRLDGQKLGLLDLARVFGPVLREAGSSLAKDADPDSFLGQISDLMGRLDDGRRGKGEVQGTAGSAGARNPEKSTDWLDALKGVLMDAPTREALAQGLAAVAGLVRNKELSPADAARMIQAVGTLVVREFRDGEARQAAARKRAA